MSINTQKVTKTPKVSVLMPVYKTPENYLREAVESILNQTYTDFEFLILDDCPDKPVEQIVKSYKDKRIKYTKNPKNFGISDSRNKLIDMAQGEYLAVMDHDDVSLPERFAKQVAFLDLHKEIGVVGTWYERFPDSKIKKRYVIDSQIKRDLMYNCSILHPSSMIRKSVLLQNNIRYKAEFSPAEDYALWIQLIGKTKFANIPEELFLYRRHQSNTSKLQLTKMLEVSKQIRNYNQQIHPDLYSSATRCTNYIPFFFKRRQKGCSYYYKICNFIKIHQQEKIIM